MHFERLQEDIINEYGNKVKAGGTEDLARIKGRIIDSMTPSSQR